MESGEKLWGACQLFCLKCFSLTAAIKLDSRIQEMIGNIMVYECKIYDKHGNLKKEISSEEITKNTDADFIDQKSTKLARKRIASFKEKKEISKSTKFYTNKCVQCGQVFHPRQHSTKYCSHECQKKYYYDNKRNKEA